MSPLNIPVKLSIKVMSKEIQLANILELKSDDEYIAYFTF